MARVEFGRVEVRGGGGGVGKVLMPVPAPTTKVFGVGVHGGMRKGKGGAPARTPVASEVGPTMVSSTAASSEPLAPTRSWFPVTALDCRRGSGYWGGLDWCW